MDGLFVLAIELGNDAMQTPRDVALALENAATRLRAGDDFEGLLRDENGNTVGSYGLRLDDLPARRGRA